MRLTRNPYIRSPYLRSMTLLAVASLTAVPQLGAQAAPAPPAPAGGGAAAPSNIPLLTDQTAAGMGFDNAVTGDPRKPPVAKPGAMTLAQVVDAARAKNPTLLSLALNLRAVRAQEIQAAVRINPNIGVAGQGVSLSADGQNPYTYSFQASRLFELGGKRGFRIEAAKATTMQTARQLEDAERQTILSVKTAFTTMLMAKASLELAQANLKEFNREVQINKDRFDAGDIGKLDFERLDLQLGNFENDEATAQIALRQASDQLQTLIGVETPSVDFDVQGDIIPPPLTQSQADLITTALAKRPDYAAAQAGVAVAAAQQKLAYANATWDPTVEAEYDKIGHDNSAGFNVNIPLRIFDRNQGNKETARFTTDSTRLAVTAARNQVISDVDQAYVQYLQSRRLSDRFGAHYLDEAVDVLTTAQFAYEHGGLALVDYLDALRETRTTTAAAISAYANTWMAIHQLSAATATEVAP